MGKMENQKRIQGNQTGLGGLDSQCRNHLSAENHFDLCCFATFLTWIYALNLEDAPERRHPSRHSGAFSFAAVRWKIFDKLFDCSILPYYLSYIFVKIKS
ncbi:MAG: hypothetical protein A2017_04735 [Lentisphaerae bacterium GWF2_44_16]|nr:MAG: hypothetical protein A2017_04735 [Lentisphaerae bacterium GWF2_44_16]